jgi:hypothetical protein
MRTLLAACALALPIPAAVAGCGSDSGSSSEDPQQVLDDTFNNDAKVSSGNLDLTANVSAGDAGSFDLELQGPFQTDPDNPGMLPQLDWTASAKGGAAGQNVDFSGQLVITSDNAYVVYNGNTYEVGADMFKQFQDSAAQLQKQAGGSSTSGQSFSDSCKAAVDQAGGDSSVCDVDFTSWLTNLSNEGTEDVEGTSTVKVSGDADVQAILTDFINIAKQTGGAADLQGFDPSQLGIVEDAIKDAHIDVYSGEDDNILRKLDFSMSIDPSAIPSPTPVPVDNIDVNFGVTLSGVNEDQTIEAPSGEAKPISDLLGSLGALGGIGGLGSIPGAGSSGSGSGGGGIESANQKYLDCVAKATSPDEINKCTALL